MNLKAIVIGAGWAGEGHTVALRAAGVEVVAMCGRAPEPAHIMAQKLAIPHVRFDWLKSISEFEPDIVAIATPAAPHHDIAVASAHLGCHVLCDKPLAARAAEARAMLLAVDLAGVKHAYGPTSCFAPAVEYARALVADGVVGQVVETESVLHFHFNHLLTYNWFHSLGQGGGMLNNGFTHKLAQVLRITGGSVRATMGEARTLVDRAPVGRTLHDFRDLFSPEATVSPENAQAGEWRVVDADFGYTVMLQLQLPQGNMLHGLFQASGVSQTPHADYLSIHGTAGTLHLSGPMAPDRLQQFDFHHEEWVDLQIPNAKQDKFPLVADYVQRDWNELFDRFVKDVRGEPHLEYPTFRDGCVAAEIIDIARSGRSWTEIKARPGG